MRHSDSKSNVILFPPMPWNNVLLRHTSSIYILTTASSELSGGHGLVFASPQLEWLFPLAAAHIHKKVNYMIVAVVPHLPISYSSESIFHLTSLRCINDTETNAHGCQILSKLKNWETILLFPYKLYKDADIFFKEISF